MKEYIKNYAEYFDLGEQDNPYCEYHWIFKRYMVVAVDVHHIRYRSQGGKDDIYNLIGLCRECHNLVHDGKIGNLSEVHKAFIKDSPYD